MPQTVTAPAAAPTADEPLLSRTGFVGPYGPLVSEFKTRVDIDLELAFRRKCAEAGTDAASVIRNWINQAIRGETYDEACFHASQRRAQMLGLRGPNESLQSEGAQA